MGSAWDIMSFRSLGHMWSSRADSQKCVRTDVPTTWEIFKAHNEERNTNKFSQIAIFIQEIEPSCSSQSRHRGYNAICDQKRYNKLSNVTRQRSLEKEVQTTEKHKIRENPSFISYYLSSSTKGQAMFGSAGDVGMNEASVCPANLHSHSCFSSEVKIFRNDEGGRKT